jgi:hypothetical protein
MNALLFVRFYITQYTACYYTNMMYVLKIKPGSTTTPTKGSAVAAAQAGFGASSVRGSGAI